MSEANTNTIEPTAGELLKQLLSAGKDKDTSELKKKFEEKSIEQLGGPDYCQNLSVQTESEYRSEIMQDEAAYYDQLSKELRDLTERLSVIGKEKAICQIRELLKLPKCTISMMYLTEEK